MVVGGGGGTVIITSAPGPGLCHSQRFFERFFGDSLRDSLEMDLDRSLTILLLPSKVFQVNATFMF